MDLKFYFLFLKIGDYVSHCIELGQFLVGDDDAVLILDAHQKLKDVQGIGPQVFFDEGVHGNLGRVQAKLLRQDGLYFFKHKVWFRGPVEPG